MNRLGTVSDQLCPFLGSVHSVCTARFLHKVHVNEGVNVTAENTVNSASMLEILVYGVLI